MDEPEATYFLGKGERVADGTSPAVLERRARHAASYAALVASYRKARQDRVAADRSAGDAGEAEDDALERRRAETGVRSAAEDP